MQAQGLVDVEHGRVWDDSQPVAHPLDGDRSDLLSLRLGVAIEPRFGGWKQDLERIKTLDVRSHRNHSDHTATQSFSRRVGRVVTDDHGWPALVGLGAAGRIEIDRMNVAAPHHDPTPSPVVDSQTSASPSAAHSSHAASYVPPNSAVRSSRTARWSAADRDWSPCSLAQASRNWTSSPGRLTL